MGFWIGPLLSEAVAVQAARGDVVAMHKKHAAELSIREYLDDLAAKLPAPGGGSASALVGATAAALGAMVANFTVGQEKFAQVEEDVRACLEAVEEHRRALIELIQADMDAYGEVSAAYKLPKEDPARKAKIQQALRGAARVPLQIMEHSLAILELLPALLEKGNPNLVSDVGVAAACAECALRCAWLNVEINLAYMDDAEFVQQTRQAITDQLSRARELAQAVWQGTVERVVKE